MSDSSRTGKNAGLQEFEDLHLVIAQRALEVKGASPAYAQGVGGFILLGESPVAGVISSVWYYPNALITGADNDTRLIRLINRKADNSGALVAASLQFNLGVNALAKVKKVVTLTGVALDKVVAVGDVLEFASSIVGAGLADSGGLVVVRIAKS